jgi:hypothetical protein
MTYAALTGADEAFQAFSQGLGGRVLRVSVTRSAVVPLLDASEEEVSFG